MQYEKKSLKRQQDRALNHDLSQIILLVNNSTQARGEKNPKAQI